MLDAYIIDAIRKEELEREREAARRRVWLELPLPPVMPPRDERGERDESDERDEDDRGPVVIPFGPDIRDVEEDAA